MCVAKIVLRKSKFEEEYVIHENSLECAGKLRLASNWASMTSLAVALYAFLYGELFGFLGIAMREALRQNSAIR